MIGYVEALEAQAKYGSHALTLTERAALRRGPEPSPREDNDDDRSD